MFPSITGIIGVVIRKKIAIITIALINLYDTDRQREEVLKVILVSTSVSCGTNMYIKHADINIKT